jgi:hypothetical protein
MSRILFILLIFLSFLLIAYPIYASSPQGNVDFLTSIINSIISFFNYISSILFSPPQPTPTGGGGGEPSGPPSCSGSLSLTSSGEDTCTITATIKANYCDGKSYEIKNGGSKCSGIISGNSSTLTCNWQVTSGTYSYSLYLDNTLKSSGSITCPKSQPKCSDGTLYGKCSSTKPKYCDNGNLVDKCTQCGCPTGQICNTTTNLCYKSCSGSVSLTLNPPVVAPNGYVTPSASGLSDCNGKLVEFKKVKLGRTSMCSDTTISSCILSDGSSCTGTPFIAYPEYGIMGLIDVCVDKNRDGDYADSGESNYTNIWVTTECLYISAGGSILPNPATLGSVVTAWNGNFVNCKDKTVFVRKDSCGGTTLCSCVVPGIISSCSCNFTASCNPSVPGANYMYYVGCIDTNGDGYFKDHCITEQDGTCFLVSEQSARGVFVVNGC